MKAGPIFAAIVGVAAIGFGVYIMDMDHTNAASRPNADVAVNEGSTASFEADTTEGDANRTEMTVNTPGTDAQSSDKAAANES